MFGSEDLDDEAGELSWLDKALEELVVKESYDFVDYLEGSNAELWVDGRLIVDHEDARQ